MEGLPKIFPETGLVGESEGLVGVFDRSLETYCDEEPGPLCIPPEPM